MDDRGNYSASQFWILDLGLGFNLKPRIRTVRQGLSLVCFFDV